MHDQYSTFVSDTRNKQDDRKPQPFAAAYGFSSIDRSSIKSLFILPPKNKMFICFVFVGTLAILEYLRFHFKTSENPPRELVLGWSMPSQAFNAGT